MNASIQWYPGHIAKLERKLDEWIKLCDVVIELIDSRIPNASYNPRLSKRYPHKPRIILLNKADLADQTQTKRWQKAYQHAMNQEESPIKVMAFNAKTGKLRNQLVQAILPLGKEIQSKRKAKGLKARSLRVMVVGMPNVGKSTLINQIVERKKTKTGHKAGVTRQTQWVRIHDDIDLLDTPGVIPPKLEERHEDCPTPMSPGELLAVVSSVGEAAYDEEPVAQNLLNQVEYFYPGVLHRHYDVPAEQALTLTAIGQARQWLAEQGEANTTRTARGVLTDFRNGRWGALTLEWCINESSQENDTQPDAIPQDATP